MIDCVDRCARCGFVVPRLQLWRSDGFSGGLVCGGCFFVLREIARRWST